MLQDTNLVSDFKGEPHIQEPCRGETPLVTKLHSSSCYHFSQKKKKNLQLMLSLYLNCLPTWIHKCIKAMFPVSRPSCVFFLVTHKPFFSLPQSVSPSTPGAHNPSNPLGPFCQLGAQHILCFFPTFPCRLSAAGNSTTRKVVIAKMASSWRWAANPWLQNHRNSSTDWSRQAAFTQMENALRIVCRKSWWSTHSFLVQSWRPVMHWIIVFLGSKVQQVTNFESLCVAEVTLSFWTIRTLQNKLNSCCFKCFCVSNGWKIGLPCMAKVEIFFVYLKSVDLSCV